MKPNKRHSARLWLLPQGQPRIIDMKPTTEYAPGELPDGVREHLLDDVPDACIAVLLHPDTYQQRPAEILRHVMSSYQHLRLRVAVQSPHTRPGGHHVIPANVQTNCKAQRREGCM